MSETSERFRWTQQIQKILQNTNGRQNLFRSQIISLPPGIKSLHIVLTDGITAMFTTCSVHAHH